MPGKRLAAEELKTRLRNLLLHALRLRKIWKVSRMMKSEPLRREKSAENAVSAESRRPKESSRS